MVPEPLFEDFDGRGEVVAEGHQHVDIVEVAATAEAVSQVIAGVHRGEKLADETIDGSQTADDILWPLADHLNTTRDVVRYAAATDTTSVTNHLTFDAFGNVTSETSATASDDTLFHHTGKILDEHIGLQWHRYRWYDPVTARWQSADPIGFTAGDANLYRYVGNNVLVYVDPHGLQPPFIQPEAQPGNPAGGSGFPNSPIGAPPAIPGLPYEPTEPSPFLGSPIQYPTLPGIITDPGGTIGGIIGGELPGYQNSEEVTCMYVLPTELPSYF